MKIDVTVNGTHRTAAVEPRLLLVDLLRDTFGLTGTKCGCETGECGACVVLVNGVSAKSCLMLAAQADGGEVETIEGVATGGELNPLQQALWEAHAVQNGFSTPGVVMSITDLLRRNPHPDEAAIRSWLDGCLCRVTGYQNIIRAVESVVADDGGERATAPPQAGSVVGAPIKPKEAPALLRGEAQFTADISLPNMLHAAFLHSSEAHAIIKSIDTSAAAAMPGVARVFTGTDVQHLMPTPVVWVPPGVETHFPPHPSGIVPGSQPLLAKDRVRFFGEPVAAVVAETRQQAFDALDKIAVVYESLPAVVTAEEALKPGAPQLHDAVPNNLVVHTSSGDRAATEAAIAAAPVVVRQRFHNQRMMANIIEPRASIGQYDAHAGQYTLWTSIQPLWPLRLLISQYVLGIAYSKLRVIAPHFGGSNGSRGFLYVDAPLVLFFSKELGRPVKWVDTRAGLARSTAHGRDQVQEITLAGTKDGKITALSCTAYSNIGAYPVINALGQPLTLIGHSITGQYSIDRAYYECSVVLSNTVQVGSLRGSGRAEATFLTERMVDIYARQIGIDPAEVRRRNMVPADRFPYNNGLGWTYDSGNFQLAFEKALAKIDYGNLSQRKAEARQRGKRLGVGIGSYVAASGVGPSAAMGREGLVSGTWGCAYMRVEATGEVAITTGAQPHGQSQETTLAQIAGEALGIAVDLITVYHSDTAGALYFGQGSYGSRSLSVEGAAVYLAAQKIKEKARRLAAHTFKAAEGDVSYEGGKVFLKAAPSTAVMTLQQVAYLLWLAWDLPETMEPGLDAVAFFDPPNFNFPFGTHIALVEVDEKTGQIELKRYVAVDDFGNIVNPGVVDGQTHGNIALGVGQALFEEVIYDKSGHLITDSYSTYVIPKASQMPRLELERTVTASPVNPLGAKGAGDVSNPPVAPAIVNAVCDALADLGITHIEMPVKPERAWRAMREAEATRSDRPR